MTRLPSRLFVVAVVLLGGCARGATRYDPAHDLGLLFQDVQLAGVFPDSKTFVDARPLVAPAVIVARYDSARRAAGFQLADFVHQSFALPHPAGAVANVAAPSMEDHIRALWPLLTRSPDTADAQSSLIPLPHPYIVPGGRFREVYYWDSYFTMLGLIQSGRTDLVRDMLDNFSYLIATVGHIPNGNRTYYLSRSQPPYFAAMVGRYAAATDTTQALRYLDALETEYSFWMNGGDRVAPGEAYRRVVRLRDGSVLNRYWDDRPEPRPESFTLETTELAPVDLNCLLYTAERTIAALHAFRRQPGDAAVAQRFVRAAENRQRVLLAAAYDSATGFFYDVRWRTGERVTDRPTLAAAAPLYFGLASPEQGRMVAARLEREFLKPGGFVTTLVHSGQQWDAPNGWPPLEWLAIEGVRRYGGAALARAARDRWLALNRRTYRATGRMMEKYDVTDLNRRAGGGEYPTQDGFGWTNGVALALSAGQVPMRRPRSSPRSISSLVAF